MSKYGNKYGYVKEETVSNAEVEAQYAADLFRVAQDRYSIVKDVNFLCGPNGDIRFQRANSLIGEDSAKGGFSIVVNGSSADRRRKIRQGRPIGRLAPGAERVQKILDDFLERTKLHILCVEHAKALLRDGDLFLNVVADIKSGLVLRVKRAPALTIKKNVDEYGEFIAPEKAFSQIDATEIYKLSQGMPPFASRLDFALYQMNHIRWLSDETQIYGVSQYGVSRRCYRMLEKMEEALANRRIYRSVSKRSHKIERGSKSQIEEYKRENAMVDRNGAPTKNTHMLTDYIGNVEITALHDEANLDEIKDLELMENTLWINLLVPKAVITGGQGINRDVLKVQYPHYLQSLETITDRLEYGDNSIYSGYRAIIDLQLMLAGINPESVSYDVVWSQKSGDTMLERVEGIQLALGKGGGRQLISHEKAIQLVAVDFDIEDPAVMYKKIQNEGKMTGLPDNKSEMLTDEADGQDKADKDELEDDIKGFGKEWSSFFNSVYFDMLNSPQDAEGELSVDKVVEATGKAIERNIIDGIPNFYMYYMSNAGFIGADKACKLACEYVENSVKDKNTLKMDTNPMHSVRPQNSDIYNDLLNLSGERIKNINGTTLDMVRRELADGFDRTDGWRGIMEKLRPIIQNDTRSEAIAISELSWAYNREGERVYKNAGFNGLEWDASLDIKTCDYCRSMHGEVFPIDNHPDNPGHTRCRCTWRPTMI